MERRYILAFVLLCALWGFSFVAIKYAVSGSEPIWLAALRLWGASVVVFAWAAASKRRLLPARDQWAAVAALGAINAGLLNMFLLLGMDHLAAGLGSILLYTYPLIAGLVAAPVLKERIDLKK